MKTFARAALAAFALAALLAVPAFAGDDPVPAPASGDKPAAGEGTKPEKGDAGAPAAKPAGKAGEFCPEKGGPCLQEDGSCAKDCPAAKAEPTDLDVVTVAALEGNGAGAKAVLAGVAEEVRGKLEAARKEAFDFVVKARKEMVSIHRDLEQACAEAKAEGREVACEVKSAMAADLQAIHGRIRERVAAFSKSVEEAVGNGKVAAVAAEVRKAGDAAKELRDRVKAAVDAALAEDAKKCDGASGEGGDCGGKKPGTCGSEPGVQ